MADTDLYKLPIATRPAHRTPLRNRLLFYPVFAAGVFVILGIQATFVPLGIASWIWISIRRVLGLKRRTGWLEQGYEWGVRRTKQLFGMLREFCGSRSFLGLTCCSDRSDIGVCADDHHIDIRRLPSTQGSPRSTGSETRYHVSDSTVRSRHHVESPSIPRLDLYLDPRSSFRHTNFGRRK
jgi:hypothetical protein